MTRLGLPLLPSAVRWALAAAVVLIIFINSILVVPPGPPEPGPLWDKKLHFAAYATLTASLAYATARSDLRPITRLGAVILAAILYGIGIELLQAPLPNRFFSVGDMLANAVGALLGGVYLVVERRVPYVSLGPDPGD